MKLIPAVIGIAFILWSVAPCAGAADLPTCTAAQEVVHGVMSTATIPGNQAIVKIETSEPSDPDTFMPNTLTASVNGGEPEPVRDRYTFEMPEGNALVQVVAEPQALDPVARVYVSACIQTVTATVRAKRPFAPYFAPILIEPNHGAPRVRFELTQPCRQVDRVDTSWKLRVGGKTRVLTVRHDPCEPFAYRPVFNTLSRSARRNGWTGAQSDFYISFVNSRSRRTWHFRKSYWYTLPRYIPDTDFDSYVNICINQSLHIYARGGHLWCTVAGTQDYDLRQVGL
jgi:hypothetical protein